jgi:hypothetical protein
MQMNSFHVKNTNNFINIVFSFHYVCSQFHLSDIEAGAGPFSMNLILIY